MSVKLFPLFFALVFVVALLAGCTSQEQGSDADEDVPREVSDEDVQEDFSDTYVAENDDVELGEMY